jgi:3-hydroxyisobutyrate dehydrogenase
MKIAFIGLGHMGGPMSLNLHKSGFDILAFDVSPDARKRSSDSGLTIAGSAAEAIKSADVVVTMLPASEHVEGFYLGKEGMLGKIGRDTLIIDCSTIAVGSARKVAAAAADLGLGCIDAPVSGGTGGAIAGTLTFMVGGSAADLERARPILQKMGQNIFHAGAAGAGQAAKICNNMLLAIQMIGTAEALTLGVASGLDPKVLSEIMKRSSGGNWVLEKYNPMPGVMDNVPASKEYAGGFGTDLMLKDLGLAQEAATSLRASTPLGGLARSLFAAHSLAGNGSLDFSSVIRLIQKAGA